jgi:hypothetical protein
VPRPLRAGSARAHGGPPGTPKAHLSGTSSAIS